MNSYQERKYEELQLLSQYVKNIKFSDKTDLKIKIKAQEVIKKDIPFSNMSDEKFYFGKNSLDYSYLRFKHDYAIFNEKKLIGLHYNPEWYHKTIYFNSGMSAITALIESVFQIRRTKIAYSNQIYFETYKILQATNTNKEKYFFAFYDAIEPDFRIENIEEHSLKKNCLGIIIDTTCLTETKLDDIVQNFINCNKIVFLVKSFTKLDMLSTEYSRLGCLTMIASQQLDNKMAQVFKDMYVNIKQKNINYNCCPSPLDFPPFWDDNEFFRLNEIRIKKIKSNNSLTYEKLKTSCKVSILKPNHQLFLLIYPKENYSRDYLIRICKEIALRLSYKFDIKYCGSFGFDFIALDTYVNISDNKETIRLSLNDYDDDMVENFSKEFLEAIDDYF